MFRVKVLKISAGEPLAVLRAAALEDVAAVAIFEALEEAVLPLAADEARLERPFHRAERRERVVGGRQLERRGDVVPGRDDVLRALEGAEGPQRLLVATGPQENKKKATAGELSGFAPQPRSLGVKPGSAAPPSLAPRRNQNRPKTQTLA